MVDKRKKLLFSINRKDVRWDYYRGSGKGGQKRNKTSNCCRCTHEPSGAVGKSEEGRSQGQNRQRAFRRMAETTEFQLWAKLEAHKVLGELEQIEKKVDHEMEHNIKFEIKDLDGKWVESTSEDV